MAIIYASQAKEDYIYWKKNNLKIFNKIKQLLEDIKMRPFTDLGKPEPLRFKKSGYWSRRINHEHRLVYKIVEDDIYIAQCRYHY